MPSDKLDRILDHQGKIFDRLDDVKGDIAKNRELAVEGMATLRTEVKNIDRRLESQDLRMNTMTTKCEEHGTQVAVNEEKIDGLRASARRDGAVSGGMFAGLIVAARFLMGKFFNGG